MSMLKGFNIGNIRIDPPIVLAPMAGFTDSPFRSLVKEFAAGLVYTEMISSMGIFYKDLKTIALSNFKEVERPISAQIFGNDPDKLAYASSFLEQKGFDCIDINMGCPAPKIVNSGSGASLIRHPDLVKKIAKMVRNSVKIPITVKLRKGFHPGENFMPYLVNILEGEGIDAISVHGIAVDEGFKKEKEDWESIRLLQKSFRMPIIANGGIVNESDVKKIFKATEASGVMIGRACIRRPWFIKSALQYIEMGTPLMLSLSEKLNIIIRLIEMEVNEKGENIGIKEMRKFVHYFTFGMKNATTLRNKVNIIDKKDELIGLLKAFFEAKEAV